METGQQRMETPINSYTGPDNHWQRNLRTEIWDLWQSLYRRAVAMVQNESIDLVLLGPHAEIAILTNDLCTVPRLQDYPDPAPSRTEAQRREHDILLILQNPALVRMEAQRRGLDILQILQALLDIGNATENAPEHLSLSTHEMWDLQQHHRSLILHLYVLLPILFLRRQQKPCRVGRTLLIELLSLRHRRDAARPDPTHAQYFGHLWTSPVPGRKMKASSQAADWADTLCIWIHLIGTLA